MLDCIKYVNSFGDTIEFNKLPYMLQSSDLKDYKWSYSTKNEYNPKIYSFSRNMVEKKVQIAVVASTKKSMMNTAIDFWKSLKKIFML